MSDLPPELRDRAAGVAALTLSPGYALPYGLPEWRAVVDAVAEVLAERQAAECSCIGFPQPEGPYAWCDVHGQPSVAWSQGIENGVQQERVLSEMRLADLRDRAERAEADLARARNLASEVLHLMRLRLDGRPVSIGEAHTLIAWSRGVLASGPAGAAHTEED